MITTLDTDIQFLKGVGEKRAALYRKLDIETIGDLLRLFPRDYIDLSSPQDIASAPIGERCAIRATVVKKGGEARVRRGLSIWKVQVADGSAVMTMSFYNTKYTLSALKEDETYLFYGTVSGTLRRREMSAPTVFPASEAEGLWPVYPLTAGLSGRMIAANMRTALSLLGDHYPESLPESVRLRHNLASGLFALQAIHFPKTLYEAGIARKRWIFEELFTLSLALIGLRRGSGKISVDPLPDPGWEAFYGTLPFTLTGAQQRAIAEIAGNLASGKLMNRLLQGDVGSGKTVVAAAAVYMVCRAGKQAAMMAPTEILATQHYNGLASIVAHFGIRHALITGSTKASEKRRIKAALAAGEIDFIIGTHALLTGDVQFNDLSLVITDEQHRFGVAQRAALSSKSSHAHTLVMSATPIPRTLSLIIYGDLDLSVIDELPAGRQPIETYRIDSSKRGRAYSYIKRHLDRGLQGYIICPLVEENLDLPGLTPAVEYADRIAREDFKGYRVGLLHGKMKPKDKNDVMARFYGGDIQLLVATTVVEVGVDVPNAVIMLIEGAERFGLGQLHQLRGRIGRGSEKSTCILLTDINSQAALERLDVLRRTQNGFDIAEADLRMRGPGDFFGERQHGLPPLKLADLADDFGLLQTAQQEAEILMADDPDLSRPEHSALKYNVAALFGKIGTAPN